MAKTQENKGAQELNEALNKSEAFIKKYKKALIAAIVAIIVIVAGIIFYNNYQAGRSVEASTAISTAQELIAQQQYEKALKGSGATAPGLIQVASDYSGTEAGNLANYYAGLCYAKMDKWDEAINYLEKFSPKSDLIISPMSQVALGDAYANKKRYDDAIDAYQKGVKLADKASESGENNAVSPMALKKLGIILYEQGKKAEALKVFQEIKEKYVNAPIVTGDVNQFTGQPSAPEIDKYIELVSE